MNWTRDFWSSNYTVFEKDAIIGTISKKFFSSNYECQFQDKLFFIKRISFFCRDFVVSKDTEPKFAEINFPFFSFKPSIVLTDGATYIVKKDSFWGRDWSILKNGEVYLAFKPNFLKGEITGATTDVFLVLAGLVVKDIFRHKRRNKGH